MKKLHLKLLPALLVFSLLIFSCRTIAPVNSETTLISLTIDSLIAHKNYFAARDLYMARQENLSHVDQLRIEIFLDHAFNKATSSTKKTEELFSKYDPKLSDSLKYRIEALAHVNYSRDYHYHKAYSSLTNLLHTYEQLITEDEKTSYNNTLLIWKALRDQPAQFVRKHKKLDVPIIRDKAGLQNLLVTSGEVERNFIFDTGANISTITESTAEEFGVMLLDGNFEVDAITGNKISSRIGLAPEINLGSISLQNVIFLVFPDDALAFPQIDFQINGILGFPVMEALDEIHITRDDRFIVPIEQSTSNELNLALDFLTPLLYLQDKNGKGVYTFDTGANKTMLYNTYREQHRQQFHDFIPEVDYTFGGAGGVITKKGVYIRFSPIINEKVVEIDSVIVLKEPVKAGNLFNGNLGQDLIHKFDRMIINFDQMFLKFE